MHHNLACFVLRRRQQQTVSYVPAATVGWILLEVVLVFLAASWKKSTDGLPSRYQ
jgi:hypothetical protein